MTTAIRRELRYEAREAEGTQSPVETLTRGSGTCRDFALLMMEAVRSLGFAARFVSGYLYDDQAVGGGATHAWVQVYLPGGGWVEFDPTNALVGGQKLVRVAVTRDPAQAIPVSGTWTGAPSDFLGMTLNVEAIPRDDASGPGAVGRRRFRASPDSRPAPIVVGRSPPKD